MNSDNLPLNEHVLELQEELIELSLIPVDSKLVSFDQIIGGGSDTLIFELCFEKPSIKFIQKVFRDNQFAEFEYENHKLLFENKINVFQPYFLKLTPNSRDKPYFVMEKVEGPRVVDVKEIKPKQYEMLTQQLHPFLLTLSV